MKVIVASANPVKIKAAKFGFQKMFPDFNIEVVSINVPSGVNDQPIGDKETFEGARNRAINAQSKENGDFYIGIEGGIASEDGDMSAFAWVVIRSGSKEGKAKTSTFYLPRAVAELIEAGKELGEADDIVFNKTNSKQQAGAIGILTHNAIDRTQYYAEAVVLALIPFKNDSLY